jgi:beta-alanine--pyruvate transaminase
MEHVFYTNSGSESVDTALKIAIAYHRARGEGARTRLIGRERGYHGVNFGGISVGGIVNNRKVFGTLLNGVDHLPHTHLPAQNAYSQGPAGAWRGSGRRAGADRRAARRGHHRRGDRGTGRRVDRRADPAEGLSGKTARDHEEARHPVDLRRGHHRLRPPRRALRRQHFGVLPDLITCAKGLTNGVIPMGAVLTTRPCTTPS